MDSMDTSEAGERPGGMALPRADALAEEEGGMPTNLEVDLGDFDGDSAIGDDQYTVTTSVASSAKDFRHEGGRRYHAFDEESYHLPNDEIEAGRLDLQHYIWKLTWNGALTWVDMNERIKNVLDIGTGTGLWAMELAESNPDLQVVGTDLSPIQPDLVPPNCTFLVDNAELDWVFDTKFDFIHSRMLTMGIHDWEKYFQQCWDNLEPGGWIETGETQFPQRRADQEAEPPDGKGPFLTWSEGVYEAALKSGIDARASENFDSILTRLGFINIERVDIQWPTRAWAKGKKNKVIGRVMLENMTKAVYAIGQILLQKQLGWSKEYLDEVTENAAKELTTGHFYAPMVCHKAQKPFDAV